MSLGPFVRFFVRRTASGILVLFGITLITFTLAHMVPYDPVVAWIGKLGAANPQIAEIYRQKYHLGDPLYLQYFYYIGGVLQGDLGFSPTKGEPVSQVIAQTLPNTLQVVFFALILVILIGTITAIVASRNAGKLPDRVISVTYVFGVASPPFLVPLILILVFALAVPILPATGQIDPLLTLPAPITGFTVLDAILAGDGAALQSILAHLILPSLSLAILAYGILTRILRTKILEQLDSGYIKAARARGVSENSIFFRYALKNSLVTEITIVSLLTIFLIGGDIFVENIFAYPGLGQFAVQASISLDYPGILGTTLVFAAIIFMVNLTADLLYALVDPRIRYA